MKKPQDWRQWALVILGLLVVTLILLVPLALIFTKALAGGLDGLGKGQILGQSKADRLKPAQIGVKPGADDRPWSVPV